MHSHKTVSRSARVANLFGALGYMSLIVQWSWSLLVLAYPWLMARPYYTPPPKTATSTEPLQLGAAASPVVTMVAVGVTVVVMIMTILLVAKLPRAVGRQGARATHSVAEKIVPLATKRKLVSKKRRRQLSYRFVLLLKLIATLIPVAALTFAQPIAVLDHRVAWIIALFCAAWTVVYFGVQQLIARYGRVKTDAIW